MALMEPGHRIEHYVLIEQIGQGGQAIVWSADDERLKRIVAVKAISLHPEEVKGESETEGDPIEIARRFQDEAQIIAALEHPSILPVYTYGQEGDDLYIVMRYMAGGSLKRLLQNGPMEPAQVIKSARSLADALDLAHQHLIIHRDIKSANVLLDARNNMYLADFGLSITMGDNAQTGAGTLAYMSPEQMSGEPLDHRSDLYAFGILLYEMLTGTIPRSGEHPWNYMQVLTNAALPIPESMSPDIAEVLAKATALRPEDRYASAGENMEALSAAIRHGNPPATEGDSSALPSISYDMSYLPPITDPATLALLTANSMFDASLAEWADGAGRFRFYEDDFQYVASFYSDPEAWSLKLDQAAYRLMLRASLEYGFNVDQWWNALADVVEQRGIALQTLNSERAPARMRAMQRLATVSDSEPPAIPTRVAAILSREPDRAVRAAGVALLEKQANPANAWRSFAFNETIDTTLAEIAAHDPDNRIARSAAEVCGRLYSTFAVDMLGQWAVKDDGRALRALTYVRAEVPRLPSSIPAAIRQRVFLLLSLRQFFVPGLLWRFIGAAVGFIIAWGGIQYLQYTGRDLLALQAMGNAAASGVLYSLVVALCIVFAAEPARLLQAWTRPARIGVSWVLGAGLCAVAFLTIRSFYYFNNDPPDLPWILISSVLFAAGFAIASGLTKRAWIRSSVGAAGILVGVYFSWATYAAGNSQDFLIFFQQNDQALTLAVFFAAVLGLCAFLPEALRGLRSLFSREQA